VHNAKNKERMENEIKDIIKEFTNPREETLDNAVKRICALFNVSGCFPTDKEIELLSNEHSDDMDLRPNTYHSYKDGMEECIDIIKKNINNR